MSANLIFNLIVIIVVMISLVRGWEVGWIRQFFSTAGFFGGLFIGAAIELSVINFAHTTNSRTILAIGLTMGLALIFLLIGEYIGIVLKSKIHIKKINTVDSFFGSIISLVTVVFSIWLVATILSSIAISPLQSFIQQSSFINALNKRLPNAPSIVSDFGSLIDPNGFPRVFIGGGHIPSNAGASLPNLGVLQDAVSKDSASVVKVEGLGCGGLVEGSGFVVGSDLIATDAHVVAGIKHPYVVDANGTHSASLIWFDPNLDFAVLQVSNLAGHALVFNTAIVPTNTVTGALGYPGGGSFNVSPAVVLDEFDATGRNIYGQGSTDRSVYEIKSNIIPGNSGGPLIETNGDVIGVVFAASTDYYHIGYALTANQIVSSLRLAEAQGTKTQAASCAE